MACAMQMYYLWKLKIQFSQKMQLARLGFLSFFSDTINENNDTKNYGLCASSEYFRKFKAGQFQSKFPYISQGEFLRIYTLLL